MAEFKLEGVGVALVTPFKKDLTIDFDGLTAVIEHVIQGGCNYIVALGTTAETPTLSIEEKILLTDFIRSKVDGRVPLIIGIGGNNTERVVRVIKERDLKGYSAILSVTPFYNKPTQTGLFMHYKKIAENSPLPIILYNVPSRTGVNLTAETTLKLAEIPNITGIKEASGNLEQIREIIDNKPENFNVISGDDAFTCEIMKRGGSGVISVLANAFPKAILNLTRLCLENRIEEAACAQNKLKDIISHLFEEGNPAGVKCILSLQGLIENNLRLPLVPVSKNTENKIKRSMSL